MGAFLEQSWVQVLSPVASHAVKLGFGHDEGRESMGEGKKKRLGWLSSGERVQESREMFRKNPPRSTVEDSMGDEWPLVTYVAT